MNYPILVGALVFATSIQIEARDLFAPRRSIDHRSFSLQGQGVLKLKRILPIYDAALYVPGDFAKSSVLDDIPKRLEVVYRVGAKAERFARANKLASP